MLTCSISFKVKSEHYNCLAKNINNSPRTSSYNFATLFFIRTKTTIIKKKIPIFGDIFHCEKSI